MLLGRVKVFGAGGAEEINHMLRSGETLITSELPQVDTGFEARGGQLEVEANRGSRQLKGVTRHNIHISGCR